MRRFFRLGWPRAAVALVAVVALAAGAVASGSSAASAGKPYSASISPTQAQGGVSTGFRYMVTNGASTQPLGSFRILIPAGGWVVDGATITVTGPAGKPWSLTPNTTGLGYIEAKANTNSARLSYNESAVISFSATAPCSGGPFFFESVAHQANQFLGPNNEFFQSNPSDPGRKVTLASSSGQVARVSIDQVATPQTAGVHFPVTVRTFDRCGNPTTGAAGASLTGFNPSPAPISTPMDVALSSDSGTLATFDVTAYRAETASLTATIGSVTSLPSNAVQVVPGQLGSFALDTIATPQHAGVPIAVVAHPYDRWGNAKTNYTGGALLSGDLSDSSKPGPPPSSPDAPTTHPVYGSFTWAANGDGTASAVAKLAEANRHLTVTDTVSAPAPVTATSSPGFDVLHGALGLTFTTQPRATEPGQPILSTTTTTPPNPDPVTVLVEDAYGNLPDPTESIAVGMSSAPGGLTGTLTSSPSSGGLATFPNLVIDTVGTYTLTASLVGSSATASSDPFVIANDVSNCTDVALCSSTASNGNQTSSSKITTTTGTNFQNTVLTTTFFAPTASRCSGFSLIPGTNLTDVSIQSGNVADTRPTFLVTLIIPKATLQSAGFTQRSAGSFDVCVGAKWIDPSQSPVPWTTKAAGSAVNVDGDGFYWGLAPDCSTAGLTSYNPCALLKTKNVNELLGVIGSLPAGVSFSNSDLALVVRMGYPWDGKYGGG